MNAPLTTSFSINEHGLEIVCHAPNLDEAGHTVFIALNTDLAEGSAVVPFAKDAEGSTVFLPFRANRLFSVSLEGNPPAVMKRVWQQTIWGVAEKAELPVSASAGEVRLVIPAAAWGAVRRIQLSVYAKAMRENDGWGTVIADRESGATGGAGDQSISRYQEIDLDARKVTPRSRLGAERVRIYQLLPRLFSNTNETRKRDGTIQENGVGKFAEINDAALDSLHEMGFTHLWLTGVLQQATSTDYSAIGEPADDPDLLKGLAGSPYAIKDYFDVCPDYAEKPGDRLVEFKALLTRIHAHGMKAIIDFVPNHVARCYHSNIQPDLTFGVQDDRSKFFDAANNFFYLRHEDTGHGPPLVMPTLKDGKPTSSTGQILGKCDGIFDGEKDFGRVTGNNVVSWNPSSNDWYETVKLNYGYNFTSGDRQYPHGEERDKPLPDTWKKMDRILAYWQEMGVDGFRCDMAHMVPPEFWNWALGRARARKPEVRFIAEAYDNDPGKVRSGNPVLQALNEHKGNVMFDLLSAGFDAVYDDPSYKKLKSIYDGPGWANDLDGAFPHDYIFHNSLRYAENHDEVRLAAREWGKVGPAVGRSVSAILYGLGRGPVLLYSGQEVGEPAQGAEGYGGDDSRTTIFDYWSMPEVAKWVNGHKYDGGRLSPEQKELRAFYGRLLKLVGEPAFRDGEFFPLNAVNNQNDHYGRLSGEHASGHYLYAFLRSTGEGGQHFLVVANLHPTETLRDVHVTMSPRALEFLHMPAGGNLKLVERLGANSSAPLNVSAADFSSAGVTVPEIPPLTPLYFQVTVQ